jgi:hypothetical protein
LATSEESKQHVAMFGGPVDGGPDINSMRWYPVESDVTVPQKYESNGQLYHLVYDGDSLTLADDTLRNQIETAQAKGTDRIELRLSESAGNALRELTRNHLKQQLAIIVNGKIRMAPTIQSEVGRDLAITGRFTREEIKFLMDSLSGGLVQPLSKPTESVQTRAGLQRLQGVWRIVAGSSSSTTLFAFDGSTFFRADEKSIQDAGPMTVTIADDQTMEVRLQNALPYGASQDEVLSGRFLTDGRIELGVKVQRPTALFEPSYKTENVSVVVERIGDIPSSRQEVEALVASSTLSHINDKESQTLSRALLLLMYAKQIGVEGITEIKSRSEMVASLYAVESMNQLKQIAISFQNFHAGYRKFPASASMTREGSVGTEASQLQPFSWRVAILPFIDENELFEQYRFDEPWDSEANLKLLSRIPKLYRRLGASASQRVGHTNYQGFADGTGAIGIEDGFRMQDMLDGTSDTLLIMETESSVPWTKPQDLRELPEFADGAVLRYALVDGSVRTMDPIDIEKLKALITRDGGERVQP